MRIGLLGASGIAPRTICEPAERLSSLEVAAIAAREVSRAQAFAAKYRVPRVHLTYEDLVADESLDAVYVSLPNSLHASWSIAALEAGRHVLCEKPIASNAGEAKAMVAAARRCGRELVEAFHWRYHPLAEKMLELSTRIGPLRSGEGRFEMSPPPEGNIRFDLRLGGGATMDLGCYIVHWFRTIAREEPVVATATATEGPRGVDVAMRAVLQFPSGMDAVVQCSMAATATTFFEGCRLRVEGNAGQIDVQNPMAPQFGNRLRGTLADSTAVDEVVEGESSYLCQLRAFEEIVSGRARPLTGGIDAIANMEVIDNIYQKAGLGCRGTTEA